MSLVEAPAPHVHEHVAIQIIRLFHEAEDGMVGREIRLMSGESGIVRELRLDPLHGLTFTIDPLMPKHGEQAPQRYFPVSTIKEI